MGVVDSISMELCQNGLNEHLARDSIGMHFAMQGTVLGCLLRFLLTHMFMVYVVHDHKVKVLTS